MTRSVTAEQPGYRMDTGPRVDVGPGIDPIRLDPIRALRERT